MAYKKCLICGETILDEQSVPYKGRFVHLQCFNIAMKTLHKDKTEKLKEKKENIPISKKVKKPKMELKDSLSEEEYEYKQKYYEYLRQLINDTQLSTKIYVLSEDYIKKYNFTFKGMYLTLLYENEILGKQLTGDIIGIIPYCYEEAKQYYISIENIKNENENVDISKMYKEKIIKIEPKHKKIHQIDISKIGEGR